MRKATSIFWGIVLVLIGTALILAQQQIITLSWTVFWPGVLIVLALMFHFQAFVGKLQNSGLLVPGGILLVYGGLFMYCELAGWNHMESLWPLFILGPALGLAELRLFSRGKEGSWIPVIILTVVGGFFLTRGLSNVPVSIILAVLLILIGIMMIINQFRQGGKPEGSSVTVSDDSQSE